MISAAIRVKVFWIENSSDRNCLQSMKTHCLRIFIINTNIMSNNYNTVRFIKHGPKENAIENL